MRRQTKDSPFSYWKHTDEELLALVQQHFDRATPGYRDGVVLVSVPFYGFYSNVVQMKEGDIILGIYKPRKEGEEPRKQTFVVGSTKLPARRVDIVLYRHDVLAENNEHSSDAEWEIISVNAEPGDDGAPAPMKPGTLMANYFQESGGTATGMTPEEFVKALAESRAYWNDKGDAAPMTLMDVPEGASNARQMMAANINTIYRMLADAVSRYNYYQDDV